MLTNIYYHLKPLIPRRLQIFLRRKIILQKRLSCRDTWPIDEKASKPPQGWTGWPDNKKFALVLTHDIDTKKGHEKCHKLIKLEEELGLRSSFNFVTKKYKVSAELRYYLESNGFEVGIHGLYHDGKLYKSKEIFQSRAIKINHYLKEWKSIGFRSPAMHHNLDWIHNLNIKYDTSTFDTDPFEPQSEGIGTIFPLWISENSTGKGYVELPYTLPQDFTLFVLMKEKTIDIWKQKLDWIAKHGGMALLNTHPDYMNFGDNKDCKIDEFPVGYYIEFLKYIKERYNGQYWHVGPKEMARTCLKNYEIGRASCRERV